MTAAAVTRFASRLRPGDHLHIEDGSLAAGPTESGWLSAQWVVEPVEPGLASTYFRFQSLWQPDRFLHAESGVPEAGAIEPGMLSAQWRFEPVADAAFVRLRNRWPLVQYAHIESGAIDVGRVGPGWLSAQWLLQKVPGTKFVRLSNRWKPEQCLNIESGALAAGPVGPGWLSAQWSVEKVAGSSYVRFGNRWKPDQYFHMESGKAEAGAIASGWLSAQWLTETVAGTTFVRLRNRWEVEPCLHIERGVPEVGLVEPGWLSAQWLAGSFRRRVVPMSLFQRRLDEFINQRDSPLFMFRVDDNKLSVLVENPLKGTLEQWGETTDLGKIEVPYAGNNIHIRDLNTEQVTIQMTADPADSTPEVETRVRFETKGTEVEINNFPNVNLTGAKVKVRLRLGFDPKIGLIDLGSFVPLIDQAVARAKVSGNTVRVDFRGQVFEVRSGAETTIAQLRGVLRGRLMKEFVSSDVAVNVNGVPDGAVAGEIEGRINSKLIDGLIAQLNDGAGRGWTPWSSVSEGSSTAGAPVAAVATGPGRVVLFVADRNGGVYTAVRSPEGAWGGWVTASEGSTTPGGHVTAVMSGGHIELFLADPGGGIYTAPCSVEGVCGSWSPVRGVSTVPGAPIGAVVMGLGRIALFLADADGIVRTASRSTAGVWGGWSLVSEGATTPGGHVTAVASGDGRITLILADRNGGIYSASSSPNGAWGNWAPVSHGSTTPGAPVSAVVMAPGRVALFVAEGTGGVYTAASSAHDNWGPWAIVSEGSTTPGGHVTAVAGSEGRIALFVADRNGGVYTALGNPASGFGPWSRVSEGSTAPGGYVAAVMVQELERATTYPFSATYDRIALTLADANGGIYGSRDGAVFRPGINRRLTRLLVGGDHRLLHASSDADTLTLDYLAADTLAPFPEQEQIRLEPEALANIDHIVVLMMENRSFDHMLGYLGKHGGRSDIDGLQEVNPDAPVKKNKYDETDDELEDPKDYLPFPLTDTRFEVSPCHGYDCVDKQINTEDGRKSSEGAMGGFVADFAERAARARSECVSIEASDVMGYYQAHHVPVFDALAREFLVCDQWFCSHPGPTFPNRFYATTGRLNRDAHGRPELNNPKGIDPVLTKTVFDHLTSAGVSWRYFEHGYCFLRLFDRYRFDDTNIVGIDDPDHGFFAAAKAGTLPSVSFIDPDFIEVPPGNDDHAPADVLAGQHLIGRVAKALIDGQSWSTSLLLVTYDEHGGFYDHVKPPPAVPVSGVGHYGVRVPALVVSPWVDRGVASDTEFDHTSIVKTICRRFLGPIPPDMGERVAAAADLAPLLRTSAREDRPEIALPPGPPPTGRFDWTPWSSVSEGNSTAGAPIAAVVTGPGRVALFVADRNGGVYTAVRSAEGAWGGWVSASEGSTTPGGHVTAVSSGDGRVELFLADPGGGVFTAACNAEGVCGSWSPVRGISTVPGAPIGAVVMGLGRIALFVADADGIVRTVSRSIAGVWGGWTLVSEGATTPGGHVTSVASGNGLITLILADRDGGIYSASSRPGGTWGGWAPVSHGSTLPGAPVSAVVTGPGRVALFVADRHGGVYTAASSAPDAWGPWDTVSEGSTTPGGHVTAVAGSEGRIALFVADTHGGVYTALGNPDSGFGPWSPVSEGHTAPGGYVAAVTLPRTGLAAQLKFVSRHDHFSLARVDLTGEVEAARTCAPLDVQNDGDFHDLLRSARYMFFQ